MNMRRLPLGPVFSHQPVNPGPIVDQMVRFTGNADGCTRISIESGELVQAVSGGTSAYWLDPSNDAAVSGSPGRRPATPIRGEFA
jgi:hypothetical protein